MTKQMILELYCKTCPNSEGGCDNQINCDSRIEMDTMLTALIESAPTFNDGLDGGHEANIEQENWKQQAKGEGK
jgi:hypothetical protein